MIKFYKKSEVFKICKFVPIGASGIVELKNSLINKHFLKGLIHS